MLNKKLMILAILLVNLLAVSVVSAADNATSDVVSIDNTTEDTTIVEKANDIVSVNDLENDSVNYNQDILESSESQDEISLDNGTNVLSTITPSYDDYEAFISSIIVNSDRSVTITVYINPCIYPNYYTYYFKLDVYDSNGNWKNSKTFYSIHSDKSITHTISSENYDIGSTYTVQLTNVADHKLMDIERFTFTSPSNSSTPDPYNPPTPSTIYPHHSDYLVTVSNTTINYGTKGYIYMNITPAFRFSYKYYYYLDVYDSTNFRKISKLYYNNSYSYSENYKVDDYLSPGNYTIKIRNYADDKIMSTAKLIVKCYPLYSDYSVNVSDTNIVESNRIISMNISPASTYYKYYYYLKIYDLNNDEKISQLYNSTSSSYSEKYRVDLSQLNSGNYTIKIINYYDNKVMDTASLKVYKIPTFVYGSAENISYSEKALINVKGNVSGIVIIDIDNTYTNQVRISSNELKTLSFANIPAGKHNVSIVLKPNDSRYNESYYQTTFTVSKKDVNVELFDVEDKYYSGEEVAFDAKSDYEISISLTLGNKVFKKTLYPNSIGQFIFNDLPNGFYEIILKPNNNNYNLIYKKANFTISKKNTILNTPKTIITTVFANEGFEELVITLTDEEGNDLSGMPVTINLNGKTITKKIEYSFSFSKDNWLDSIVLDLKEFNLIPKTYVATITFAGNDHYNGDSITTNIIVNKEPTSAFSSSKNNPYGYDLDFVFDTYKSGFEVTVKINGISKTLTTGEYGSFYFPTTGLVPKTYVATITFAGNSYYEKSVTSIQVTVKKATLKLTAKSKAFKKSVKTKKYSVTLKTNQNKAMKNVKLTLKVGKKTYAAKTNKKGVATFKITKLTKKGTFKATITYNGSAYYNKVTKKVNIKCK